MCLVEYPEGWKAGVIMEHLVGVELRRSKFTAQPPYMRYAILNWLSRKLRRFGVYHEDLNAGNVIVNGRSFKVIDFAFSSLIEKAS